MAVKNGLLLLLLITQIPTPGAPLLPCLHSIHTAYKLPVSRYNIQMTYSIQNDTRYKHSRHVDIRTCEHEAHTHTCIQ